MNKKTWPLNKNAEAAGMKPRAVRRWTETGVITLQGNDRMPDGPGCPAGFSRQRVYQTAIVRHLVKLGVPASDAALAAFEFTDRGNKNRAPGQLFEHGRTILQMGPRPNEPVVRNVDYDAAFSDVCNLSPCVIQLDCKTVVDEVDAILNANS
jgi:hypothetical protein